MPGRRTTNEAGVALIKSFEGLRLKAYLCPAGVPTIGYGHTGPSVKLGQEITEHQADVILRHDLEKFERAVAGALVGAKGPVSDNAFSACVSLAFNIGGTAFVGSNVRKHVLAGRMSEAADAFRAWRKGGGRVLDGLVRRREAERALFLTEDAD